MEKPSDSDLLGYMLGALDADEHSRVQAAVDDDPQLEEELLQLKNQLAQLELVDRPVGPPAGLARRTCQLIAATNRSAEENGIDLRRHPAFEAPTPLESLELKGDDVRRSEYELASGKGGLETTTQAAGLSAADSTELQLGHGWARSRFSFSDFIVAVTAATIIGALLFPALLMSRFDQRVNHCQNNLGQLYRSMVTYADNHDGRFISIPTEGKLSYVGAYAPFLKDQGLIDNDSVFLCPGVDRKVGNEFRIPTLSEIQATECAKKLGECAKRMSGDYGFTMGCMEGEEYRGPSALGRGYYVLLADSPSCRNWGRASNNHGGQGQNCVMEDGRVLYLKQPVFGEDLIYLNDLNMVGPGVNENDSVIAPSHVPMVTKVVPNRF
ncbi:MAG: hypothetical protein R3C03_20425 [Pirellulaceae bacterium]